MIHVNYVLLYILLNVEKHWEAVDKVIENSGLDGRKGDLNGELGNYFLVCGRYIL